MKFKYDKYSILIALVAILCFLVYIVSGLPFIAGLGWGIVFCQAIYLLTLPGKKFV